MGNFWTSDEDKNETKSPESHTTDIVTLLTELNANPSKDTREFEIIERQEVNTQRLLESLEEMKDNETFKQFETYQMVMEKMPLYVITKKPIGGENKAKRDWNFKKNVQYCDVYGADTDINDKIRNVLLSFFTSVIADIVMQYCGENALLFSVKKGSSGGMTLTTTTLIIEDALEISSTYSEKSGRSNGYKLNKKYDKKLHMYLTWLVSELHYGTDSRSGWDFRNQVFRYIDINKYAFRAFVAYEILEKPRPPPREHICVLADCLVEMECGKKAARDICAGDIVRTANGSLTKVMCTVTQRIEDVIKMCNIGECCITPEHPIRNIGSDEWQMPYDMVQSVEMYVDQVNNFVLESGHCVIVDDVECITLGHMLSDPMVKHHVWGTQVVCDFLKSFPSHPDVVIENSLAVQYLLSNKSV